MNDDFVRKVRLAAVAGWWTLLIAAVFLSLQWIAYLVIMDCRPEWVLRFWGGHAVSWPLVQTMWLWLVGIFKMIIWVAAMIVIWLTLWARALGRS